MSCVYNHVLAETNTESQPPASQSWHLSRLIAIEEYTSKCSLDETEGRAILCSKNSEDCATKSKGQTIDHSYRLNKRPTRPTTGKAKNLGTDLALPLRVAYPYIHHEYLLKNVH